MARSHGLRVQSPCDLACAACDRGPRGKTPAEAASAVKDAADPGDAELRILGCDPLALPFLPELTRKAREHGYRRVLVESNGGGLGSAELAGVDELIVPELLTEPALADLLMGRPGAHARLRAGLRRWQGPIRLRVPILSPGTQEPERALAELSGVAALEPYVPSSPADPARARFVTLPSPRALADSVGALIDAAAALGIPCQVLPRSGIPLCALPERHRRQEIAPFNPGAASMDLGPDHYAPACARCAARSHCSGLRPWQLASFDPALIEPLGAPIAALSRDRAPEVPSRPRAGRARQRFRVVLANLVERSFGYGPGAAEYLRAALLTAPDLAERVEVEVAFLVDVSPGESVERLLELEPDLLGMSTYSWNLAENARVCRELRTRGAHFPVVWGGPSFASFARDSGWFSSWDVIDAVAIGSGEHTLVDLVRHLVGGQRLEQPLPGLAMYREGRVVLGGPTREPSELDELASPFALGVAYRVERPTVEMARGCIFDCSFCSDARSSRGGGLREHSLPRIARDVAAVTEWPEARSLDAGASTANVTDAFFARVCDAIRLGDPGQRLSYGFQLYPSLASAAQRAALEGIRVGAIHLGVQSLTRDTFLPMRRGSRADYVERALSTFRDVGPLELSVIVGLPGETFESFVAMFERLLAYPEARLVVNRLLVLPGTAYHLRRHELGIELDSERYFRVLSTPTMSRDDLRRAQDYVIERACSLPDLFSGPEARVRWVNFDVQARFGDPPEYAQQ